MNPVHANEPMDPGLSPPVGLPVLLKAQRAAQVVILVGLIRSSTPATSAPWGIRLTIPAAAPRKAKKIPAGGKSRPSAMGATIARMPALIFSP